MAGTPFFIGDRHENLSSDLLQKILSNKDLKLTSPSYPQEPISTLCYLTNIISMLLFSEQTDIRPPLSSATAQLTCQTTFCTFDLVNIMIFFSFNVHCVHILLFIYSSM